MQVVEASLDAIAPGQSKWLLQKVLEAYSHSTDSDVNPPRCCTLFFARTNEPLG